MAAILSKALTPSIFSRAFSSAKSCNCTAIPSQQTVDLFFKQRCLGNLGKEIGGCVKYRGFNFQPTPNCELVKRVNRAAAQYLPKFPDVVHVGQASEVFLEALKEPTKSGIACMTGDRGEHLVPFLEKCLEQKLLLEVGSLIDIGGQNHLTAKLVAKTLKKPDMPALVLDINKIMPALNQSEPHIKYAVDDGSSFFSSPSYSEHVGKIINEKPCLFIFNNFLNVLKADHGWRTLEAAWEKLRPNDYLIISGVAADKVAQHCQEGKTVNGIVEYYEKNGQFHRSVLSSSFPASVKEKLPQSAILKEEPFKKEIEGLRGKIFDFHGYRMLVLRKSLTS